MLKIFFIGLLYLLSACSTPARPFIELQPQFKTTPDSRTAGKSIRLMVIDARQPANPAKANIDPAQNVRLIFHDQLAQGFISKGFDLSNSSPSANQLSFKLLSLDYRSLSGYFSSNIQTFVSAQVTVQNTKGSFTKTYNASVYNDNYLSPITQTASEHANIAVNKLLDNILNDPRLLQFLTTN